jgi:hypothetical protein
MRTDVQRFEATRRQLRMLWIVVAVSVVAAVVVTVLPMPPQTGPLKFFLWGAALIGLWRALECSVASTECTPDGICTTGLSGALRVEWSQIADIVVYNGKGITGVAVVRRNKTRVRLYSPVNIGWMIRDPEFYVKFDRICAYWHDVMR